MEMNRFFGLVLIMFACSVEAPQAQEHKEKIVAEIAVVEPEPIEKKADEGCVNIAQLRFENVNGTNLTFSGNILFTGDACSYHKNGKVFTQTHYSNGIREGAWTVYYDNGQVEKRGLVKNGKEHGAYNEYYPSGQMRYEYTYENGLKTGVWKSWYEDGTPYTERHFIADQLHGKVLVWDELGRLAKEYDYINGRKTNSIMHFKDFE